MRKYVRIKYDRYREKYEEKCDTIRISFVFVFAKDSRYVRPVISLEFSRNIIKHLQEQIENDFYLYGPRLNSWTKKISISNCFGILKTCSGLDLWAHR